MTLRHPAIAAAWWREKAGGVSPLEIVCLECIGAADDVAPSLMSTETFSLVARRIFPYASAVNFLGRGEPLENERLPWMIRAARSYGLTANVTTNGILMDEGKICELIAAGTRTLIVRLEGAQSHTHDALWGAGSFERAVWNMRILLKVKRKLRLNEPVLLIDTTLTPANRGEIPQLLRLAQSLEATALGVSHSRTRPGVGKDGQLSEKDEVSEEDRRSWEAIAHGLGIQLALSDRTPVLHGRACVQNLEQILLVTWDGKVHPCCPLIHQFRRRFPGESTSVEPPTFGDLIRQSFSAILRSKEYRRFRDEAGEDKASTPCRPCPLYQNSGSQFKE
jgi:MoaA/NifB/PqqE/SkfB family radical SAM enzyme